MRDAQAVQCQGVQRDLVCRLRQVSGGGEGVGVLRIRLICPANLHRPAAELPVFRQPQHDAAAQLLHIRVVGDQVRLLLA